MNKLLHTKAVITKDSVAVSQNGIIDGVIGSTEVLDRMGDIIAQDGWDLKDYQNNPVILWGHNMDEERPPIAKALKVWVQDKGKATASLMFKIQFDLQDSFAAEIYRKVKEGFINTVSVGFLPSEYEELDPGNWFGGLRYTAQQLLELSFVPVPANPQALVPMKSFAEKDKRLTPVELKDLFPQVKDNRYKKMLKDSKELTLEQVEEDKDNEYQIELKAIDEFDPESFRVLPLKKEDKEYLTVIGKLKDSDAYVEQSLRYDTGVWDEQEVKEFEDELKAAGDNNADQVSDTGDGTVDEGEGDGYTNTTPLGEITVGNLREEMTTCFNKAMSDANITPIAGKAVSDTEENLKDAAGDSEGEGDMTMPHGNMKVAMMTVGHTKAMMGDVMGDWMSNLSTTSNQDGQGNDTNDYAFTGGETKEEKLVKAKALVELVEKAGRVLSGKNEDKIKNAIGLLNEVISELQQEDAEEQQEEPGVTAPAKVVQAEDQEEIIEKGVIGYSDEGKSPEGDSWDGAAEMAKITDPQEWKAICTWFDSSASDNKGSYKLPHHKGDSGHPSVWKGVAAAMGVLLGARGGVSIPEGDRKGVYNHLVKHYEEYGKTAPEFKMVEDQVLAEFDEEINAVALNLVDRHMVKLVNKVLENQKLAKKNSVTQEQTIQALEVLNSALSKVTLSKD